MATLTKTVTLSSAAGGTSGILADALSISMSKALTVTGPHTLKKMTVTTAAALELVPANADKRTLVYIKNNAASATGDIKVYHNSDDGAVTDGDAIELFMEIAHGEFALFPTPLDKNILAQALSADAPVEVGTFVIGDDFA
jgi:hypothetical protein|tara:strand:+ start:191 stop:613 length:423 start_codon:yes stop_codon:yes gene_type:complete